MAESPSVPGGAHSSEADGSVGVGRITKENSGVYGEGYEDAVAGAGPVDRGLSGDEVPTYVEGYVRGIRDKDWTEKVSVLASLLPDDLDVAGLDFLTAGQRQMVVDIVQAIKARFDDEGEGDRG